MKKFNSAVINRTKLKSFYLLFHKILNMFVPVSKTNHVAKYISKDKVVFIIPRMPLKGMSLQKCNFTLDIRALI